MPKDGALRRLTERLAREPASVLRGLERVLDETPDAAVDLLDPDVWGPSPDADTVRAAQVSSEVGYVRYRDAALSDALTLGGAAALLGMTSEAVRKRLEKGRLVGLRRGREWRLPRWQFAPEAQDPVLPGLEELAEAFPGGPVALSAWAGRPNVDLEGRTPRQTVLAGEVARVVAAARAIGS